MVLDKGLSPMEFSASVHNSSVGVCFAGIPEAMTSLYSLNYLGAVGLFMAPYQDEDGMVKDLKKNELTELISVAQEVLSTLFNSSEIRDNVKESRFSKGYECPKCQCKDVNKNGKSNGRQELANSIMASKQQDLFVIMN